MKLILFGGAEINLDQVVPEIRLMGQVINRIHPEQVLHIPFARTTSLEPEWSGDWFNKYIQLGETKYLNAARADDLAKANNPLVFISGGSEHVNLYQKIISNSKLLHLIINAEYIVGESAGATVLGEYRRSEESVGSIKLMKQLGIIKNTVVVPHYTERNREETLRQVMAESGVKYGLGIDCMTAIEFELHKFPQEYQKIGIGSIEIKAF